MTVSKERQWIVRFRGLCLAVLALVIVLDVLAIWQAAAGAAWPLAFMFIVALPVTIWIFVIIRDFDE